MSDVNPYQPMQEARPAGEAPRAPRWLAILVSVLAGPGTGLLVLGRRRLAALWMGGGMALFLLSAFQLASWLTMAAMVAGFLTLVGGIVATCVSSRGPSRSSLRTWGLVVSLVLGANLVASVMKALVCEAFQIPNISMVPTLLAGDQIFVKKWRHTPERGDVIVFRFPPDPSVDYIKRVIALPGETVSMRGGQLLVDDRPFARRELDATCDPGPAACRVAEETFDGRSYLIGHHPRLRSDFGPVKVPPQHYFVMGDSRDNSNDSRVWGTVPEENVKGVATVVWYSQDSRGIRVGRIGTPIR
jgi:signal peptidase I